MSDHVGVGLSRHRDPRRAGSEAAAMAMESAGCTGPAFVWAFSTVGYPQQVLIDAIHRETGNAPLCGCSGEGVIAGRTEDESNFAVAVMVVPPGDMAFSNGLATGLKADPEAAGREIGRQVRALGLSDSVALFVFPDGLGVNFDALRRGCEDALGPEMGLPMFGGAAADNWAMHQTYQYFNDLAVSDGVAWAVLSGPVKVLSAVNHGCVPIGGRLRITRGEGNVIREIDGRPALEVLKEYLFPEEIVNWDRAVGNLSLGFRTPAHFEGYDDYMIRFIPTRDEATSSFSIQTDVHDGDEVWMTRRDAKRIADGARQAATHLSSLAAGSQPRMVLQFDCAGRGKVMLDRETQSSILRELQDPIGPEAPWIGLNTFGEIGPVGTCNCFHNYTVVLAAIYDADIA